MIDLITKVIVDDTQINRCEHFADLFPTPNWEKGDNDDCEDFDTRLNYFLFFFLLKHYIRQRQHCKITLDNSSW